MNKKNITIILNGFIIVFEVLGLIHNFLYYNRIAVEYFTEEANILLLVSSLMYLYYLIGNKKESKFYKLFRYISVVGVTITFFVVLFILFPMANFNFFAMFLDGTLLYHHLLCPIMGMISFIFLENNHKYNMKENCYSLVHLVIYAIIMITLNILKEIEGPYPFLMVYKQSISASITWVAIIFGLSFLLAYTLRFFHNERCK